MPRDFFASTAKEFSSRKHTKLSGQSAIDSLKELGFWVENDMSSMHWGVEFLQWWQELGWLAVPFAIGDEEGGKDRNPAS